MYCSHRDKEASSKAALCSRPCMEACWPLPTAPPSPDTNSMHPDPARQGLVQGHAESHPTCLPGEMEWRGRLSGGGQSYDTGCSGCYGGAERDNQCCWATSGAAGKPAG